MGKKTERPTRRPLTVEQLYLLPEGRKAPYVTYHPGFSVFMERFELDGRVCFGPHIELHETYTPALGEEIKRAQTPYFGAFPDDTDFYVMNSSQDKKNTWFIQHINFSYDRPIDPPLPIDDPTIDVEGQWDEIWKFDRSTLGDN